MTMSMFSIFGIAGSAVSAQSQRLNVVASNLANADAVAGPDGQPYKGRQVVFKTIPLDGSDPLEADGGSSASAGVQVDSISENQAPGRKTHEPGNPMADADGYVTHSNVNPVEEMVNMISASRSYQNNVEVMNTAKNLLLKTLQIGQ
jgi:flagellar basal-body rod protein FlgC